MLLLILLLLHYQCQQQKKFQLSLLHLRHQHLLKVTHHNYFFRLHYLDLLCH